MAEVCSYGNHCLRLPVSLVKCVKCPREPRFFHHMRQAQYEHDFNVEGEMVFIFCVCIDEKCNFDGSQEVGQEVGQEVADFDTEVDLTNGADKKGDQESEVGRIDGEAGGIDEEDENASTNNEVANEADQKNGTVNEAGQIDEEVDQIDGEVEPVSTNNEVENMSTNNEVENVSTNNEVENVSTNNEVEYVRMNKKRNPPTTALNRGLYKKKKKRGNCRKCAQVKLGRDNLFHILKSDN